MRGLHLFLSSIIIFSMIILSACSDESNRKIKLSDEGSSQNFNMQAVSSVLQVEPEQQHTVAIFLFENRTEDANLDWLSRGLSDMLAAELSQSLYFNVVPIVMLYEKLDELGEQSDDLDDVAMALKVARKAQVETILTGSFYHEGADLKIEVKLRDVQSGQIIRSETVSGASLERVFLMVDELSQRLRVNLRGDLEASRDRRLRLTDMTHSVEAFRCYSKALEYMDKILYKQADSCLVRAVELDSTFASAYLKLAYVKYKVGQPGAVSNLIVKAKQYSDRLSEPDRIFLRIYEAKDKGDTKELVQAMHDLLKFEPYDLDTRMQLANNLNKFCQYDRALEEYEMILELDPGRKMVYNQLGYLYANRGDFYNALWYLDKYEELAPDEPNPYDSKGDVLMQAGRFQEAIEQYSQALAKRPDFYSSARKLSEIYSELGDLNRALQYSDTWISTEPNQFKQANAYLKRANMLWRFGKTKEAKFAIEAARKISPFLAKAVLLAAEMYKSLGDNEAAKRLYDNYLEQYKDKKESKDLDYFQMHDLLEFCAEADFDTHKKIQVLERFAASEKRPLQRQFYDIHLGILYLRMKDYATANKYFNSKSKEYLDLVAQFPHVGWSSTWKYSVEAITLQPKDEAYDLALFNEMVATAENAGRKDLAVISNFFLAQYHGKYGRKNELKSTYLAQGAPLEDEWRIIGPFENKSGFHRVFPPDETIDPAAVYQSKGRALSWQSANDGAYDGYIDLRTALNNSSWAVGYGVVNVTSPEKRKVQLRLATDEACKLWVNDELVWQVYRKEEVPLDHDIVSVVLHRGDNKILIKVTNSEGDWGFYLRITDEDGNGFQDIKFKPVDEERETFAIR